ncbi:CocE/NonD family hydrolase [Paraconexibacter algicola]|uniref:ABC transporter ATP-binding protein n=1 Tax=Paraconexibacter algicola TaxID=2133960 RepID=A0A2T4UFH9_9ACTN|nr:CocE/NonD family hydrolase [Paraconexibacter algicola]PTL56545.1 ABC transporter ATP-binding protein [Paraconexibacter algicola]
MRTPWSRPAPRRAALSLLSAALVAACAPAPACAQDEPFTVKTLRFDTRVGPQRDQRCEVVGDLYVPRSATAATPAPAILTTNGFGGSKDDQAPAARAFARRGYVVLSYSGLGFGGSRCRITLDDPDFDGRAGQQLITFLGGGSAATDGTRIDVVRRDTRGSDGRPHEHDPRVGMIGGSYGGQVQFAVAGVDPRLDTIVPQITWNDLSYALAPNNTSLTEGVSAATPGVHKTLWTTLFFSVGLLRGVEYALDDPARLLPCPNFADQACRAKLEMDATGHPSPATVAFARHASVATYLDRVRIPTFLQQGQADTLFNLQESLATYRGLRARGVPVRLFWHRWGHSGGAAPGEIDPAEPERGYETRQSLAWFEHYLKDRGPRPPQDFQFFRDWVDYEGDAGAAYAAAPAYPVGATRTLRLSGTDALVPDGEPVRAGAAAFTTTVASLPTSFTELSALTQSPPVRDLDGTFAAWSTAPLPDDVTSVGVPRLTVRVQAPRSADPAFMPVLFAKLYDVAPDGTVELTHRLISPVRIADPSQPVEIELPGVVHRYRRGHTIRLVLAGGDAAYRGGTVPMAVRVLTDATTPGTLVLPVEGDRGLPTGLEAERAAARTCTSRRTVTFRVPLRRGERITRVETTVDGRRRAVRRGRSLRATVVLAGLPRGTVRVRVRLRTSRDRTITRTGTYRLCARR